MKKSLTHLPQHKRRELKLITDTIVASYLGTEMIILFGSYARGNWVEDTYKQGHITYEYKSDYDILVITETKKQANDDGLQRKLNDKFKGTQTDVNLIYHPISQVNTNLESGWYFFSDIKKEGIILYDSGRFKLAKIKKLSAQKRAKLAKTDFNMWFKKAKEFYDHFEFDINKRRYKLAAFDLHQTTESLYMAIMLVFTNYKPKTHDIEKLGRKAAGFDPRFLKAFPRATKSEEQAFNLLKKAYIDARYKKDYKITKKQLEYLASRVKVLQKLTKKICTAKIDNFV
ncbi:MAG: HEPN domain-containing protein [Planctomycetota bacterium]